MKNRGFSLTESLIVVAIIALIAALAINAYSKPNGVARTKQANGLTVYNIEGCEYFGAVTYGGAKVYSHKGNCTNSIHRIMNPEVSR